MVGPGESWAIMVEPQRGASATIMPAARIIQSALVTGATGFVGANLVRVLLEERIHVRALLRGSSDRSSLQGLEVELTEGELQDREVLRKALSGCQACFHLAATISGTPDQLRQANVEGTRAVLETASEVGTGVIVHMSTMGALWRPDGLPLREGDRGLPPTASDYARSKRAADEVALALVSRGAPIVLVHPSAPVGPWDRAPTVSGKRILEVLRGKLPSWGAPRINHVPVGDVARGALLAARRGTPGASYLLAHREGNLTRTQFVDLVARAGGVEAPREAGALRRLWRGLTGRGPRGSAGGSSNLACDPSATIAELNLPQSSLEVAFRQAVDWFRGRGLA